MKAKRLLSQLAQMEDLLNDFSFEELGAGEGARLKKSFNSFKESLEEKIFSPSSISEQELLRDNENQIVSQKRPTKQKTSLSATMLIANVSHEIRTPLNGIIGFTDLLKEDGLSDNQLERVEAIKTASSSLMEIINELLEYSKLSEGLEQTECIDFNFHSVIENVTYLCKTLITEKNVVLRTEIEPGIPKVLKGDPSKLSQILLNLLGNAIKFVDKGEIKLTVIQKSQRDKKLVLGFSVSDTGIGISEDHLGHIFDSFRQAENSTKAKYGGTGLGLTIVKQIIELLGGTIKVASIVGKGTTFGFQIPYERGNAVKIVEHGYNALEISNYQKLVKDMRILVFEDNVMNQKLIEQRLIYWGCNVFVTNKGPNGLEYLEQNEIDLVLMDLRMPGMNGYEITEHIRNHKTNGIKKIPVIAVTADFTVREKEKCEVYGFNDYILKPFNPEELLMKLIKNVNKRKPSTIRISSAQDEMPGTALSAKRISLKNLLEDCLGNHDFFEELIRLFKMNVLEFIGAYSVHLKNGDYEGMAFASHKLKSVLKMLQANSLLNMILRVQKLSKEKRNLEELKELKASFMKEYALVEADIEVEMKELANNK